LPSGLHHGLDRLVAFGRTDHDHDLGYLRVDRTFADALHVKRSGERPLTAGTREPPAPAASEPWAVADAIIETRR